MRQLIGARIGATSDRAYAVALTALFLGVTAVAATHHEMWRDEIQAWLLGRDSASVIDLYRHLRYEGHPGLWHVCLMALSRLTWSPVMMQVFHLAIATATAFIIAWRAPFGRAQRALAVLGYFFVFEYAVVCRDYALAALLLAIYASLHRRRHQRFLAVAVVLALLAHTAAHGLILAIVIAGTLLAEAVWLRPPPAPGAERRRLVGGLALIAASMALSIWRLRPAADVGFASGWATGFDPGRALDTLATVTRSYLPIPRIEVEYWVHRWLETFPAFVAIQPTLSVLLVVVFAAALARRPLALVIYAGGTIGLLVFGYVKYSVAQRHWGFLFLSLFFATWIAAETEPVASARGRLAAAALAVARRIERPAAALFTLVLAVQLVSGAIAVAMEVRYVFSAGAQAAEVIRAHGLAGAPLVGVPDYNLVTVVGYLRKPRAYAPSAERYQSFVVWDRKRVRDVSDEEAVARTRELAARDPAHRAVLVHEHQLDPDLVARSGLRLLIALDELDTTNERFVVYELSAGQ